MGKKCNNNLFDIETRLGMISEWLGASGLKSEISVIQSMIANKKLSFLKRMKVMRLLKSAEEICDGPVTKEGLDKMRDIVLKIMEVVKDKR